MIEWYDRRNPREAETGIHYFSETALKAENGRLRIVEPFRIAIPEHPASEALIAEAELQTSDRDFWMGTSPSISEDVSFGFGRMTSMLRISEAEWRNPERAILSSEVGRYRARPKPDFSALATFLDEIDGSDPVIALSYVNEVGSRDVEQILLRLKDGHFSLLDEKYERGIPKAAAARFGLLISLKTLRRYQGNPFYPDLFDEYVPLTCIDGVMTPQPETPGLVYWFRDRCSHPDYFRGINFFGKAVSGTVLPTHDRLIFDRETGDLWWLHDL